MKAIEKGIIIAIIMRWP